MPDLSVRTVAALARRAVVFELRLYRSLFRWVTRRVDRGGPEVEPFGYAQAVTPVMWLWIFASAAELPLVHVLVPWETVRIFLLVVGVWGLAWMVGLLASLQVYPHQLSDSHLRVRHGASVDIRVPWANVASVKVDDRDLPSAIRTLQPRETESGTDLQVGVSARVVVHASLREPMTISTHHGPVEFTELSFWADEPRVLADRARRHISAAVRTDRSQPGG
ncbi:MAG TPA: hypothetical protein VLA97_13325 [Nocardioidaceae bacterium]|nr:hypothetical protein [Nocardioidaceae bacterium]